MDEAASVASWQDTFGASRDDVVAFVRDSIGTAPSELERLTVGDENEVYRASTVYVRIRRPDTTGFAPELWAMDQARAAGIPVPTVLGVGAIGSTDDCPRDAMVIAAAHGRQLADLLPGLRDADRREILRHLGGIVASIHEIPTPSVGKRDTFGAWPEVTDEADQFVRRCREELAQLAPAGLRPDEIQRISALIGTSPDTPTRSHPVLCHGDLHAAHVFVHDGQVSGVIDWGLWHGGSAIGDLASMLMLYAPPDFDAILAGHGTPADAGGEFRRRLDLSIVHLAIGNIVWHVYIGNHAGIDHYVRCLRDALSRVS